MGEPSRGQAPRRARVLRAIAGAALAAVLVLVVLTLLGEAHDTRGALTTLRHAEPALVVAAALAEALSYLALALVLALLVPGLGLPTSACITVAAFGAGSLVPGQPAGGIALTVRELARRGLSVRRATPVAVVLLAGAPAASMALLAGPTLVASAAWAPLPDGWRALVALLGALALLLGGAIAVAIASPAWLRGLRSSRLPAWVTDPATRGRRGRVLTLAAGYWIADATCLWLVARALGVDLPPATLPIAYVVGAVVIAIPVLPGGLGGVEAAVPLVLAAGPVRYGEAVLAVLAWRALSFWLPAIAGLGCIALLARVTPAQRMAPGAVDEPVASH
jgi:uncharacterized membrane protein YbhN (UPF0104 family)